MKFFFFLGHPSLNSILLLLPAPHHSKTRHLSMSFLQLLLPGKSSLTSSLYHPPDRAPHILTQDFPWGLPLSRVNYIKCPRINCFLSAACNALGFPKEECPHQCFVQQTLLLCPISCPPTSLPTATSRFPSSLVSYEHFCALEAVIYSGNLCQKPGGGAIHLSF